MSVKKYTDSDKIKTITDDLVAHYDGSTDTYYISFHAKDFELNRENKSYFINTDLPRIQQGEDGIIPDKKKSSIFLSQMHYFSYWLNTVKTSRVILMADFNTECEVVGTALRYSNKEGKGIEYIHRIGREMSISKLDFNTTNKMRLQSAQLPKMFKSSQSKCDLCIEFYPRYFEKEALDHVSVSYQITCYDGAFGERKGEHKQNSQYPSDHDAVVLGQFATLNCFSSGPSFDGSINAENTYEFIPEDKTIELESYRSYITEVLSKCVVDVLGEQTTMLDTKGFFDKSVDKFSEIRCNMIDVHLHPDWMPKIMLEETNGEELWVLMFGTMTADEYIAKFKEDISQIPEAEQVKNLNYMYRFNSWREKFDKFIKKNVGFMKNYVMHFSNAWQEILNSSLCKEFFISWYDDVTYTGHSTTTKLELVRYLIARGSMVVGLQEVMLEDKNVILANFLESDYNVVFNETQISKSVDSENGVETFGCLIIKK